jgi:single-strand DNA-binding protein
MPSGDTLTSWRLVTRRSNPRPGAVVDTIRCVTFDLRLAVHLESLNPGDRMSVAGSIRCRIYGPAHTKVWRVEVEAHTLIPLSEPAAPASAPPSASADLPAPLVSDLTPAVPTTFLRTADTSVGSGVGAVTTSRNKGVSWTMAHPPSAATPLATPQRDHLDAGRSRSSHRESGGDAQQASALEHPLPDGRRRSRPIPAAPEKGGTTPISTAHSRPLASTTRAQDPHKGAQPGRSSAPATRPSQEAGVRPGVPPPRSPYSSDSGAADSSSPIPAGLGDQEPVPRLPGSAGR